MPKPKKITISLFLITLAALYLVIEIFPMLTGALTGIEVLEYGELRVSQKTTLYIVRSETVFGAPASGDVAYKVSEGDLLKRGTKVLEFRPGGEDSENARYARLVEKLGDVIVRKPETALLRGVFSTYIDGYEGMFSPQNMESLSYEDVRRLSFEGFDVSRKRASSGEPLYKISDNSNWYLLFWSEKASAGRYVQGSGANAVLPEGEVAATVHKIVEDGDRILVILRSTRYYKGFSWERKIEGEIVSVNQRGLLVSNSSLTTKDGIVGVYVRNTIGDFNFKPVRTIATDGKKTLVIEEIYYDENGQPVETVKVYDEVLKNPEAE